MEKMLEVLTVVRGGALAAAYSPAVAWVLTAMLLIVFRFRFRRVQRESNQRYRQLTDELKSLQVTNRRLEDLMLDVERRLQEAEERSTQLVPPPTSRSGLNLTKRSQAARMFRRGDQPQQIAATLCLPRNEVDLLLKIQKTAVAG